MNLEVAVLGRSGGEEAQECGREADRWHGCAAALPLALRPALWEMLCC